MYNTYIQVIERAAQSVAEEIIKNGHAEAGVNGPYNNTDTPLRNSAHWYIIFSFLNKENKSELYGRCQDILLDYLLDKNNYGHNGAPKCRLNFNGDDVNGLIGSAWVIEALICAYRIKKDKAILDLAYRIFSSQKYDTTNCLWRIIGTDGKDWGYDLTFNHQLWFAALGCELVDSDYKFEVECNLNGFLNNFQKYLRYYPNGLFCHIVYCHKGDFKYRVKYNLKIFLRYVCGNLNLHNKYGAMYQLEKGYLTFDLYGFAIIKNYKPDLNIFSNRDFLNAVHLGTSEDFLCGIAEEKIFNKYAYGYNSPAFEYPYIASTFNVDNNQISLIGGKLMELQNKLTFDQSQGNFSNGVNDPQTLNARLYELVRYLNFEGGPK